MKEGKRIENPGLMGANCKFAPVALNIFSANPEEPSNTPEYFRFKKIKLDI